MMLCGSDGISDGIDVAPHFDFCSIEIKYETVITRRSYA
jgi:hypothetical protein